MLIFKIKISGRRERNSRDRTLHFTRTQSGETSKVKRYDHVEIASRPSSHIVINVQAGRALRIAEEPLHRGLL